MSKFFKVEDSVVNPTRDQRGRVPSGIEFDTDLKRGFEQAAKSGQSNLAMQYISYMLDLIDERLGEHEQLPAGNSIREETSKSKTVTKKAIASNTVSETEQED